MPKVAMVMIVIFYEMFICCLILCCENLYEFASVTFLVSCNLAVRDQRSVVFVELSV